MLCFMQFAIYVRETSEKHTGDLWEIVSRASAKWVQSYVHILNFTLIRFIGIDPEYMQITSLFFSFVPGLCALRSQLAKSSVKFSTFCASA